MQALTDRHTDRLKRDRKTACELVVSEAVDRGEWGRHWDIEAFHPSSLFYPLSSHFLFAL